MVQLLLQAEVIGENIGHGIMELIVQCLIGLGAIVGLGLFLWLVRKLDKKLNK